MMVATFSNPQFFLPDGQTTWHANTSDDRTALCGQAALRYNVDQIADVIPLNGTLCAACDAKLRGDTPAPAPAPKASRSSAPKTSRKRK